MFNFHNESFLHKALEALKVIAEDGIDVAAAFFTGGASAAIATGLKDAAQLPEQLKEAEASTQSSKDALKEVMAHPAAQELVSHLQKVITDDEAKFIGAHNIADLDSNQMKLFTGGLESLTQVALSVAAAKLGVQENLPPAA